MTDISPLTRRIVAVGILVLAILLGLQLIIMPVVNGIQLHRAELTELRAREARLTALLHRPPPQVSTMPAGLAISASS